MKRYWFWDLETLSIFTATFVDRDSDETRVFIISESRNDRKVLLDFIENQVEGLIGYNSIFFDAQVLEYIIRNPHCTADEIRRYAIIITSEENRRPDVPEWKLRHKHLDLFRALSLSVKAKRTGLKWCEYQMDFENIEDMPSQGDGDTWEEMILSYNLNDVLATKTLYFKYRHEIALRNTLTQREGINLMNSTEPDLSKKLFAKYLSKAMKIYESDLRSMGTDRVVVKVKDIIFPYVNFKTKAFQNIKQRFEKLELEEYSKFDLTLTYQGIDINYGLGGIHAAPKNKIIQSDKDLIIKSLDVVSFYPYLMIRNELCPQHIPKNIFLPLYEGFAIERRSIPKSDPRNYILKILLNATYGLTNDQYSFLRDRQVTLAICINGQLLLSMLFERLCTEIPNSQLIMLNTDGGEILIRRDQEELYDKICKEWESLTKLELEFVDYQKLIIRDVNNYTGIYTNGKTKCKGSLEFKDIPLHKNKSHNIIPISIYEYFVNGKPIEDTIRNHTNIYDFCAGVKSKSSDIRGKNHFELHWIDNKNEEPLQKKKLSKTVRYFISTQGQYLFKCYADGTQSHVEAPLNLGKMKKAWKVTYFNKYYKVNNFEDYLIDYTYYIHKAKEIIFNLEQTGQTSLF